MVGYRADIGWATIKRKARGMAYERSAEGVATSSASRTTWTRAASRPAHRSSTSAPASSSASTRACGSERNGMITMNDWLESTLRSEIQLKAKNEDGSG